MSIVFLILKLRRVRFLLSLFVFINTIQADTFCNHFYDDDYNALESSSEDILDHPPHRYVSVPSPLPTPELVANTSQLSELGYHMDMPESNIWKFDDRILLPGIHDSWDPFQSSDDFVNDLQIS